MKQPMRSPRSPAAFLTASTNETYRSSPHDSLTAAMMRMKLAIVIILAIILIVIVVQFGPAFVLG
jgi:hypothetical protein